MLRICNGARNNDVIDMKKTEKIHSELRAGERHTMLFVSGGLRCAEVIYDIKGAMFGTSGAA